MGPPREWLAARPRQADLRMCSGDLLQQLYGRRRAGTRWVDFMAALLSKRGMYRREIAP